MANLFAPKQKSYEALKYLRNILREVKRILYKLVLKLRDFIRIHFYRRYINKNYNFKRTYLLFDDFVLFSFKKNVTFY